MRLKDTTDVQASILAIVADAISIYGGFMLATWIRFDSGWVPVSFGRPKDLYAIYSPAAALATLLFLLVHKSLGLYVRPQIGRFSSKFPRLIRAAGLGILLAAVVAFAGKNYVEISTLTLAIAFFCISVLTSLQRAFLHRLEIHWSRHSARCQNVLILGTDAVALRLQRALQDEPRLRSRVIGFLRTDEAPPLEAIPAASILGDLDVLPELLTARDIGKVVLTNSDLGNRRILDILMLCERHLAVFNMVPDLFNVLTGSLDVQSIDDIPLLGVRPWPLEFFWNRVLKRSEDLVGAAAGLLLSAPVILVAAVLVKRSSPGPVFYRQERCGEDGRSFTIYKLRTMPVDSEEDTGPVWAVKDDPRRTPIGAFLRSTNADELPQFWNVLTGAMSLVGPRPERPHFVEKFKEDIQRYMWRHVSKPGITGWAQVNGLRGDTSITERIKYDLYYLENWSLAFDLKILLRTLFSRKNAY